MNIQYIALNVSMHHSDMTALKKKPIDLNNSDLYYPKTKNGHNVTVNDLDTWL